MALSSHSAPQEYHFPILKQRNLPKLKDQQSQKAHTHLIQDHVFVCSDLDVCM